MQTKFDTLYICEIKFSKHIIGMNIISEIKEKIKRLKIPRHVSCRPVLIQVNGVTDEVLEADYFSNIIDFSKLLDS